MSYGRVEERSSSRRRSPSTARSAATSAILTDILSRSDRAPTRRTVDARPGKSILIVPDELLTARQLYRGKHFLVRYRQKGLRFWDLVRDVNERIIARGCYDVWLSRWNILVSMRQAKLRWWKPLSVVS